MCEDILEQNDSAVSSTNSTPVKVVTEPKPKRGNKSAASRMLQMSKNLKDADITANVSHSQIMSGSKRALELFGTKASSSKIDFSDSEFDMEEVLQPTTHSADLKRALDDIAYVKKELELTRSVKFTKNVSNSRFESLNKQVVMDLRSSASLSTPVSAAPKSKNDQSATPEHVPHKDIPSASPPGNEHTDSTGACNKDDNISQHKSLPSMVELVPGYGVLLSRQIDEAIDNSNNSPTRLIRHLMSAFFTKEVLATSSVLGGRTTH